MTETPLTDQTCPETGAPLFFRSVAAYGTARGVSRQAASKWNTRDGVIVFRTCPATGKDVVDALASDLRRNGELNPLKARADIGLADETPADPEPAAVPAPVAGDDAEASAPPPATKREDPQSGVRAEAARSKALQEQIRAKNMLLDHEERIGALVPVSLVEDRSRRLAARWQEALLRLEVEAAEDANPGEPGRARAAIGKHVRQLIEEFRKTEETAIAEEEALAEGGVNA